MDSTNERHGLFTAMLRTAAFDVSLLRRHPRLLAAALIALCLPALYALIYLSSMWDPASHTDAMTVALVNQDQGVEFQSQRIELGAQIVTALRVQPAFGYRDMGDAESARQAVRSGAVAFAILIPRDFSRLAVPGERAGAGTLEIYISEGNNYAGAGFARSFAPVLARRANQALNQQRWAVVLEAAASSAGGVDELRKGVQVILQHAAELSTGLDRAQAGAGALAESSRQLAAGSDKLRAGLQALDPGGQQLVAGMRQTRDQLQALAARQPAAADLRALRSGSRDLVSGQLELGRSLRQLGDGATQLRDGSLRLAEEGEQAPFVGDSIASAARQLASGAELLGQGIGDAARGSDRLGDGATRLVTGVDGLTRG
ncbi:MAG: YhgE/Pip family protein, partial [Rubrivivax sp.]|nr:YhgE/Pip family protein [Rubrivivax sp.]